MTRFFLHLVLPCVAVFLLSACSGNSLRKNLGLLHQRPDPFAIQVHKPIEFPKGDDLPAPQPGAPSRVSFSPVETVKNALGLPKAGSLKVEQNPVEKSLVAILEAETPPSDISERLDLEFREEREASSSLLVHEWLGLGGNRYRLTHWLNPADEVKRLIAAGLIARPEQDANN